MILFLTRGLCVRQLVLGNVGVFFVNDFAVTVVVVIVRGALGVGERDVPVIVLVVFDVVSVK